MKDCFHTQLNHILLEASLKQQKYFNSVLEIGTHKGRLTETLAPFVNGKNVILMDRRRHTLNVPFKFICADAESLPFDQPTFDWIISGGTFQWFKNEKESMKKIFQLLKPGGLLCFSQFLRGSMEPLGESMRSLLLKDRLLELKDEAELQECYLSNEWNCLDVQTLEGVDWFETFSQQLRFLREVGATHSQVKQPLTRLQYKKLCEKMLGYNEEKGLPLKWKASVVILEKPY